jgi:hypothetical protein
MATRATEAVLCTRLLLGHGELTQQGWGLPAKELGLKPGDRALSSPRKLTHRSGSCILDLAGNLLVRAQSCNLC